MSSERPGRSSDPQDRSSSYHPVSRRRYLAAFGASASVGVAGCSSGDSDDDQPTETDTDTDDEASATDGDQPVTVEWTYETGDDVEASPVVADDTVFIGSLDTNIYALDATDGTEQWQFETGDQITARATVTGDTLLIGSHDLSMYALDTDDGTERWEYPDGYRYRSWPRVVDGVAYANGRGLELLDVTDGSEIDFWSAGGTGFGIGATPAVADETVYIGDQDGDIYAFDGTPEAFTTRRRQQWVVETEGRVDSSPIVSDETLYIGNNDDTLFALDVADGTEQWSIDTNGSVREEPQLVDGTLYVTSREGTVYALDPSDGTERWTYDTNTRPESAPTVDNGTVYIATAALSENLLAIDADDGTEQWTVDVSSTFSTPAVANDMIYLGSRDGNVYGLRVTA